MVAFEVRQTMRRTGWEFAGSGLAAGKLLLALVLCLLGAAVLLGAGMRGAMDTDWPELPPLKRSLRLGAAALGLAALLLVPVFMMCCNLAFTRWIRLATDGLPRSGTDALLQTLDDFLYGGKAGERTLELMSGLRHGPLWPLLATMPLLAGFALCAVVCADGDPRQTLARALLFAFIIVLCVVILYPYYVMVITGFRSNAETTDMHFQHMFPTKWVWSNLKDIIDRGVPRYLLNSLMLSVGATAIALLCGIPAAYAMARMHFTGRKVFLGFVIMSQMFSPVVLLVGISRLMNALRLSDSVLGLMFINAAFNQAFAIWLLRGTFVSISSEMEQAACIDGCSTVSAMLRVLLPIAAPGIVTTLIFVFINAWNEYTISTVLISTASNKPITVGITQFSSFNMIEWQYLFAAALLATVPVVILFMCIEKHLAAGLTAGGVKG
jgi:multiple sugar transport system permease protein